MTKLHEFAEGEGESRKLSSVGLRISRELGTEGLRSDGYRPKPSSLPGPTVVDWRGDPPWSADSSEVRRCEACQARCDLLLGSTPRAIPRSSCRSPGDCPGLRRVIAPASKPTSIERDPPPPPGPMRSATVLVGYDDPLWLDLRLEAVQPPDCESRIEVPRAAYAAAKRRAGRPRNAAPKPVSGAWWG